MTAAIGRGALRRLRAEESGQVIPILLLVITLAVMSIALVVDMGFLYTSKGSVQGAADFAAMAGVEELPNAANAAQRAAEWSALNGYAGGTGGVTVRVEVDGAAPWVNGTQTVEPPVDLDCDRAGYCLRVAISTPHAWMLGQVLSLGAASLNASGRSEKADIDRDIIFILDRSGSIGTIFVGAKNKMLRFGQSQQLFPSATGDRMGLVSMLNGSTGVRHLPYTWSIIEGTLPPGLQLAMHSGRITGTPTTTGTSTFTVQVIDAAGATATRELTIVVQEPLLPSDLEIGSESFPDVGVGEWYQQQLLPMGGTPPFTWSVTGLPSGMTVNSSTGVVTGASSSPSTYTLAVSLQDSYIDPGTGSLRTPHVHTEQLTVHARGVPLTVTTTSLPPAGFNSIAGIGLPYSQQLAARNGAGVLFEGFGPPTGTPADCQAGTPQPPAASAFEHVLCQLPLDSGSQVALPLKMAIDEFIARGRSTAEWHIVLVSDGAFTDSAQSAIDAQVARAIDPKNSSNVSLNHPIRIHTIGLLSNPAGGVTTNITRMANIATATGGGYYAAPSSGSGDNAAHLGGQLDSLARALNIQLVE